jgi:hypothetical protein
MSIHFCSSHAIDFYKLAGSVSLVVPAGFDTAFVKQTLFCGSSAPCWRQVIPVAIRSDFYWQGRFRTDSLASSGPAIVVFYSSVLGVQTGRFRLFYPGFGPIRLQWNNAGVWTDLGGSLALATGVVYTVTFQYKHHASGGILEFRINNAVIASITGDTTIYNSAGVLSEVDLANPSIGSGANGDMHWAEIINTTNENPFLSKVKTHLLEADSATNVGWSGLYTAVDDTDPSAGDIINTATPGEVRTFVIDDLPALGALVVRAIQVSAMARRGATGPQNIKLILRASGANQESPVKALETGFNCAYHVYEQNQVTGEEFTKAEIDASEPGVLAVA